MKMFIAPQSRPWPEPQQVVQDARDLVEHHADVLRALRHLDAQQLLDRQAVGVLVAHHRHVVETVHVGQRLDEGSCLGQLLGARMQQADVRVGALDDFAVQFQHQAQHAVRAGCCGPKFRCSSDLLLGPWEARCRRGTQCRPP